MKKIVLTLLLFTFSISITAYSSFNTSFAESINLSGNTGHSEGQKITGSENNVYVVWQDTTPGNYEIFFSRSTDNGASFSAPIQISNSEGFSFDPQIALNGNNVYIVWQDNSPGNSDVFFSRSIDNGASFSAPIDISKRSGEAGRARLISSDGNIYVVWRDNTSGNPEIVFSRSTDNGSSFSAPASITNNIGISGSPKMSSANGNIYLVWQDTTPGNDEIFFSRSTDNGSIFSAPLNISNESNFSSEPTVTSYQNNVYVIWLQRTIAGNAVFLSSSNDNGASFSKPINLTGDNIQNKILLNLFGPANTPIIPETTGKDVYVAWQDNSPNNYEIFFSRSTDNGSSFSAPLNISDNKGYSFLPNLQASVNDVYIVWGDNTINTDNLFLRKSSDNGDTFGNIINLSQRPSDALPFFTGFNPQMVILNGTAHIVWQDNVGGNTDIYYTSFK